MALQRFTLPQFCTLPVVDVLVFRTGMPAQLHQHNIITSWGYHGDGCRHHTDPKVTILVVIGIGVLIEQKVMTVAVIVIKASVAIEVLIIVTIPVMATIERWL